jgi:hypothetical protein
MSRTNVCGTFLCTLDSSVLDTFLNYAKCVQMSLSDLSMFMSNIFLDNLKHICKMTICTTIKIRYQNKATVLKQGVYEAS